MSWADSLTRDGVVIWVGPIVKLFNYKWSRNMCWADSITIDRVVKWVGLIVKLFNYRWIREYVGQIV